MAVLRLSFQRTRLEDSFAAHHGAAHSAADHVGFAFALCWAAAAAARAAAAGACTAELALLAALALLIIAAASVRSFHPSTYLKHRSAALSTLRLLFAAAGAAVQFRLAGAASAIAAAVGPAQLIALLVLPLCWRLRAKAHFPVQLAALAIVAACNHRLAAIVTAQPAAAAGIARVCGFLAAAASSATSGALELSITPERFLIALWVAIQVQLGFHLPSSFLYSDEAAARDRFLGAYLLQCAAAFQRGSYRLGVARSPRAATLPSPFVLPVRPVGLPVGLSVAAEDSSAAAAAIKAYQSADSDAEVEAGDVQSDVADNSNSGEPCIQSAPAFESVSTHGGKRACWRDIARGVAAEQRSRIPQRRSLESISTGTADSSFQLALAVMQRRPLTRLS